MVVVQCCHLLPCSAACLPFTDNDFGDKGAIPLGAELKKCAFIHRVDLSSTTPPLSLQHVLVHSRQLLMRSPTDNRIGNSGAASISFGLVSHCQELESLNLRSEFTGAEHVVVALCHLTGLSLWQTTRLRMKELRHCHQGCQSRSLYGSWI